MSESTRTGRRHAAALPRVAPDALARAVPIEGVMSLRIGELALEGVAASDRFRVAAAFEDELSSLVLRHGVPRALFEAATSASPTHDRPTHATPPREVHVGHGVSAETMGRVLARAVYEGLG